MTQDVKPGTRAWMIKIRPQAPALKHGINLPVDAETLGVYEQRIMQAAPHMAQERYAIARTLLAGTLIRIDRVNLWYARTPKAWFIRATSRGTASVQPVEQRHSALIEEARRLLDACGMTPASAKALGLDVAAPDVKDLADFFQRLPAHDGPKGDGK